ncbi:glycoside hydrolase family 43 protein [Salibacterium lacus]|uniref:Endo-alpha-(1->5)-L-arabinanase n=1 Tax=Salibacterium lacus TaxID=1898109 RepID=A0ABW5T3X4_9BACI
MKNKRVKGTVLSLGALIIGLGAYQMDADASHWNVEEDTIAHDPTLIRENGTWYTFYTGEGLQLTASGNGMNWNLQDPVFDEPLDWWDNYAPEQDYNDIWAPDISRYNGKYWLYYSVSSFGSNDSAIGLVSSDSIQNGNWTDEGVVVHSSEGDNFNAIDPNMTVDENGDPWLAYGSYWSGLKLTRLNENTMKPEGEVHSIAQREVNDRSIENPMITYRDGSYYLFASIDYCCQGADSTYKIVVGRSDSITGPYVDRTGIPMMEGGGTLIDSGNEKWAGPGGQFVYQNRIIARHAYDTEDDGDPKLLISDLQWDEEGWPYY